ncbi:ATP-binding protein, partial [Asanoa siamensis]|uniref:ATP-binding protein n=1 Tax=Asanoa siamensis TaxID=926357 RepID=UPI0019438B4D
MTAPVTKREAEVLELLADHLANAQIATKLHISVRTVESHVAALLRKHGVTDRKQLANLARQHPAETRRRLTGLPTPLTSFVGRVGEQHSVGAAIQRGPLVTLLGPGGVGKTRLATEVAEVVSPMFDNRGGFVDLTSVRGAVAPAVAAVLGVSPQPQQPLVDAITDSLGDRPALLVLDSCEHLLDAVAELVARLLVDCPGTVVLATSRERLRLPGEHIVPVDPLDVQDDATTLFRDRAAAVDPRFSAEPATIVRICARLDGMPLAIELAAARAPALGAQGLLTALDDVLRVLAGARNPDPRHRSLRTVIDWSHHLLPAVEREVFRRLAIFDSPFDLPAATAVAEAGDATTVADLLGHLVDKNLVVYVPQAARWRLLDTVRAYGRQQLAAAGEQAAVRRRHLRWAQTAATALEKRLRGAWRDEFDAVVDDLRAALREVPPSPEHTAHQLARSLGRLVYARGLRQEAIGRYREAAVLATTPADAAADLRAAADCAAVNYRADLAFELLLAAAEKAAQAGDSSTRATMLARAVDLGCRFRARFAVSISDERLRDLQQEAVANAGDPLTTAATSITAAWLQGPPTPNPALAERALAAARDAGDPEILWGAIDTMTSVYERQGELRQAYRLARTGLPLLYELDRDDPRAGATVNSIHHMTALYATVAGDFPAAIEIARTAAADPIAAERLSLASMLVPPLVLTGDFNEAVHHADAMWHAWQASGRAPAGWLWFAAATAALAHGLNEDHDGYRRWRNRMTELAGPQNIFRLRTAGSALFADARMAVHTGDMTDAPTIVEATFADRTGGPRYRVFSFAAAAELAVAAALPDALRYVDAAAKLTAENDWATACL